MNTNSFSMNDNVLVKLTDIGLTELKRQHSELRKSFPILPPYSPMPTDDNGYTKFQLHTLMTTFGHMPFVGYEPPFEIEIKLADIIT